ncbi:MAG: MoxR family ATPase [Marinifilaceae bacterium]|nr:MoxR family ATPase [Marinifilaceae bacterium]
MLENTELNNRVDFQLLLEKREKIKKELAKNIIGNEQNIDLLLVALFCQGHVLIEGVPGLAKTLISKLMAETISADFSRIQFTPDLMPSDVIGTSVFNMSTSSFEFKKGPVFSDIVLIDEINRSPAKTQAALFEVMEENQISVDSISYKMNDLFWLIATQNPIEHEGTYRLPEAQLDRFLIKLNVEYPNYEEELEILNLKSDATYKNNLVKLDSVISIDEIVEYRKQIAKVVVEDKLKRYIVDIIRKTRNHKAIMLGASTRASVNLMLASKTFAALNGRDYVIPDDIKYLASYILQHRIILSPEAEMEGISPLDLVHDLVKELEVPR